MDLCNNQYLEDCRALWNSVIAQVAKARDIPLDSPAMKDVRKDVFNARMSVVETAQTIIPKAKSIEDFWHIAYSTPDPRMIRRKHFTGLRLTLAAGIVEENLKAGQPPERIGEIVRAYFVRGKPYQSRKHALA